MGICSTIRDSDVCIHSPNVTCHFVLSVGWTLKNRNIPWSKTCTRYADRLFRSVFFGRSAIDARNSMHAHDGPFLSIFPRYLGGRYRVPPFSCDHEFRDAIRCLLDAWTKHALRLLGMCGRATDRMALCWRRVLAHGHSHAGDHNESAGHIRHYAPCLRCALVCCSNCSNSLWY